MVFNSSSKLLQCPYGFRFGSLEILPTRGFCYLGITFSLNGSFRLAIDELTILKLVDSLVKPVALYSCQLWLPTSTNIMKELTNKAH